MGVGKEAARCAVLWSRPNGEDPGGAAHARGQPIRRPMGPLLDPCPSTHPQPHGTYAPPGGPLLPAILSYLAVARVHHLVRLRHVADAAGGAWVGRLRLLAEQHPLLEGHAGRPVGGEVVLQLGVVEEHGAQVAVVVVQHLLDRVAAGGGSGVGAVRLVPSPCSELGQSAGMLGDAG